MRHGVIGRASSVTPATVPGAPTGLSATAGDQEVDLSWTAPASNGGAAITDYEYEPNGSDAWTSTGGTAPSYTVRNLTVSIWEPASGRLDPHQRLTRQDVGAGTLLGFSDPQLRLTLCLLSVARERASEAPTSPTV